MDGNTQLRLLDRLDDIWMTQIRQSETLRRHGETLVEIARRLPSAAPASPPAASPSPAASSPSFLQLAAENGRYWLGGIALIILALRGADLNTLAQLLPK